LNGAVSAALFVRHGRASAFGADYDELSPLGVEQSELFGAWLAGAGTPIDAVFVGPRKRHVQTLEAVARACAAGGAPLPAAVPLAELDEHDGIALVFKLLPALAAEDPKLRAIVESTVRGEPPSSADLLDAFKRVTRRWVRGEIGHDEVEPWATFRARIARAVGRIAEIGRDKRALVVTSAGVVGSAVAEALGVGDDEKVLDISWAVYNASLTELAFGGGSWGLRTFNETSHLREPRLVTSI
jgi:broad specificity phosphatase PhoE